MHSSGPQPAGNFRNLRVLWWGRGECFKPLWKRREREYSWSFTPWSPDLCEASSLQHKWSQYLARNRG